MANVEMSVFVMQVLLFVCLYRLGDCTNGVHMFEITKRDLDLVQESHEPFRSSRERRDTSSGTCQKQENNFLQEVRSGNIKLETRFRFENESKFSMALAWLGNKGSLLVVTTEEQKGTIVASDVYLSGDYGASFKKRNIVSNGVPPPKIKKHFGLQRNPHDSQKVYLVDVGNEKGSRLFVTEDAGKSFKVYDLPFFLDGEITFHPNKKYDGYLLASHSVVYAKALYSSFDNGATWQLIDTYIATYKWGTSSDDDPRAVYATLDPLHVHPFLAPLMRIKYELKKYSDGTHSSQKRLLTNVVSFGHQGEFLYASVYVDDKTGNRLMKISTDQGRSFNVAQLPTITGDRFYSVLDMNEKLVFMHVDNPGDTGHGILYTSGNTGIIYSQSLTNHLYPNYGDATDFYRVESMRGVYFTSQMNDDKSIHSMITYDRGGLWHPLPRPVNTPCKDETKPCHLQIHGIYSLQRGVLAKPPLSVESAPGIVLVHGHVAESLQTTNPDVFITDDGGYTWRFALKGPHHYQIADSGSLLVAVPASTNTPKVLKFSTDMGYCWHEYTFLTNDNDSIILTGLLTEPGSKSLSVSIWGYNLKDRKWTSYVIDFRKVITKQCTDSDYETWMPHEKLKQQENVKGCLLGKKEEYKRLLKDSWCYNGYDYVMPKSTTLCKCIREDYECDYGYFRPARSDNCQKIPAFKNPEIDICLRGHEEKIVTKGYRKIPGDCCKDGFLPVGVRIDLNKKCVEGSKTLVIEEEETPATKGNGSAIAAVVIIVVLLVVIMTVFFVHKYIVLRRHRVVYRYSLLNQNEASNYDDEFENVLSSKSVVYEDSDDEELNSPGVRRNRANGNVSTSVNSQNTRPKVKSYHDDSDEDLLE